MVGTSCGHLSILVGEKGEEVIDKKRSQIRMLADAIGCGDGLARDLLVLAGGDTSIVLEASVHCIGINSVKAYIIDRRIARLEEE